MSLAKLYLTARGLDLDTAKGYGVEWDNKIDRDKIVQRLGADIALNGHGHYLNLGSRSYSGFG